MPELPEVEITARRLSSELEGAEVESALAAGVATLKTFEPTLEALTGAQVYGCAADRKDARRRFRPTGDGANQLTLLIHLMSAGRLQLFEKRASLRDRRSRILVRIADGRELRLREFGTKQSAWAKLLARDAVAQDEMVATLGPDAWPPPSLEEFAERIHQPRHLHPLLRDQRDDRRDRALMGRRDPLGGEALPLQEGLGALGRGSRRPARRAAVLGNVVKHYEDVIGESIPDKMPMPLRVHRREGEPCPRCGTTIEAVFFAEHQMNYCPKEQTGGRVLKDRRLSRLLK